MFLFSQHNLIPLLIFFHLFYQIQTLQFFTFRQIYFHAHEDQNEAAVDNHFVSFIHHILKINL